MLMILFAYNVNCLLQAVQSLLDEEFPGIKHIYTSTLHKKVTNARHDFLRLVGTENKLESLIQASLS